MASGRYMRALCSGERPREKRWRKHFFPDNWWNFERRAKLRGLRSQEELLRAQHICKSVHLLKCLSRDSGIWLAVQGAETGWYLQPGWTSPGCHQDLSVSVLCHLTSVWQREAFEAWRVHRPPLQGIPFPHSLIWAGGALHSRAASGLCQPCSMCALFLGKCPTPGWSLPSLPQSLALTSWASCFKLINFPWYFIVTKLKHWVSEILALSMFCRLWAVSEMFPLLAVDVHHLQGWGTCTQEEHGLY